MGYTESLGFYNLRKKISKHYKKTYGTDVDISNIAVTAGASASILMALMALFNEGEHIAIGLPGYPCYKNIIKSLSLKEFNIRTDLVDNFQINYRQVEKLPNKIRGLIISSPSNPTGSVIDNENLEKIVEICHRKNIILVSDEIYHGITYSKAITNSILNFDKDGIVVNSFSKYFLMTGWRLGWLIANKKIVDAIGKLAMNLYLCPSSISQYTAMEVFNYYSYFNRIAYDYKFNRNLVLKELKNLGINNFTIPHGAFYTYIDISKFTNNSFEFCNKMLEDIQVTAAPGIDFDEKRGHQYVRLSFAGEKTSITEAFKRIKSWI